MQLKLLAFMIAAVPTVCGLIARVQAEPPDVVHVSDASIDAALGRIGTLTAVCGCDSWSCDGGCGVVGVTSLS